MNDGLVPYPAMKDSGVPWLGKVPEHWALLPLKRWIRMNREVLPESTTQDYEFRYLDIGSVGTGVLTARPQTLRFGAAPSRARRVVRDGDTIVSTVRTYLKAVYFVEPRSDSLICSTGFAVLTPRGQTDPKFVSYVCQSSALTERVTADSVGIAYPAIAETRLGSFQVAVPPIPEQAAIVRFLDYADRRIRRYVRAKQKLIKLLEEQKQAIVHRAVTRGLDPSVRLKTSSVQWLGEVPEHWDLLPNRAVMRLQKTLVGAASGQFVLLSLTKRGVIPRDMENPEGKFPTSFDTYQEVAPGDLILCLFDMDETPRAVGLSKLHGMITGAYTRFACDPSVVEWVYLFYLAMDNGKRLKPLYTGLRKVITKSSFLSARFPLPPAGERSEILAAVESAVGAVKAGAERARREIDLLREYRTRLIADVVTGNLDVRDAAARLPDEPDEPEPLDETTAPLDTDDTAPDDLDPVPVEAEA